MALRWHRLMQNSLLLRDNKFSAIQLLLLLKNRVDLKAVAKSIFLFIILLSLFGCSRKNNNFFSRNWHAITTEYNTLYNGNLALELGKQELNATYNDNYWAVLPVERMQVREEIVLPGSSKNPNFAIAEEKAVKAIQRHSMLIDGRERNPQIDEAYLLLGKARYYDQRFIPAIEAFNYILHKYPLSNNINKARIWREKTNMRLEFNQIALENLKEILKEENLKEEDRADASAMLAQAYINLGEPDSAVAPLVRAASLTENNEEEARYLFIAGQLYTNLGKKDSANLVFDKIIELKRRSPRIYRINAFIGKIKNLPPGPENNAATLELLSQMERNRENRPYLDKIYFQLARFHHDMDSIALAVDYYNRSLESTTGDSYLQSLSYRTLGNINFKERNYRLAGAYFDSTMMVLPQNTREYRIIKKKSDNLEEVIYYETIAEKNDSILYLSDLSHEEQIQFFQDYIEVLKEKALASSELKSGETYEVEPGQPVPLFENPSGNMPGVPNPGSSFYFYNPGRVAVGKQEFFETWGERPLTDNWRSGEKFAIDQNPAVAGTDEITAAFENNPLYDPATYISEIPNDPAILDSLVKERNFAYYQLGLIYHEKFGENDLAAEKLELLLRSDPEERLVLPAKYNLYKIYSEIGNKAKSQSIRNDILFQNPDSRYAAIIRNPKSLLNDQNSPQTLYNKLYQLYEDQRYSEVLKRSDQYIEQFAGEPIVPKLELLKALATGRLLGFEPYKEALNFVALNYPQSPEGEKAQELYTEGLPSLADDSFTGEENADSFNLVYRFVPSDTVASGNLKKALGKLIAEEKYDHLKLSEDVYGPAEFFVVIHGFNTAGDADFFAELISEADEKEWDQEPFVISRQNYRIIQIHKNMDQYLDFSGSGLKKDNDEER